MLAQSAAASAGKTLIVNGQSAEILKTTITGATVGKIYLFTGYFANISYVSANPVNIDFRLTSGSSPATVIGVSQDLPMQASWDNAQLGATKGWTQVAGYMKAESSSFTLTLNNHNASNSSSFSNDFAVDSLKLTPMDTVSANLNVVTGSASWTKVGPGGATDCLGGTTWVIT